MNEKNFFPLPDPRKPHFLDPVAMVIRFTRIGMRESDPSDHLHAAVNTTIWQVVVFLSRISP